MPVEGKGDATSSEIMISQFQTYLSKTCGVQPKHTILLACSGGVDSMVLANLLLAIEHPFAIAHCNFQLRGEASHADEDFVKQWCRKNKVPFFVKRFDVAVEKHQKGISTQMAARELRYAWFAEIMQCNNIPYLSTAHHLNDSLETVLGNLTRGTGPKGLRGILPRSVQRIRPLLFATKTDLIEFAKAQNWQWREDVSNASDNYKRNRIRHYIVPLLEDENPKLWVNLQETFSRQQQLIQFAQQQATQLIESLGWPIKEVAVSAIEGAPEVLLHAMLDDYGFSNRVIQQITGCLKSQESKNFSADEWRLNIDRGQIALQKIERSEEDDYVVHTLQELNELPFIASAFIGKASDITSLGMKGTEHFCLRYISWPLVFRRWQQGDRIQPIGMRGTKLVSDVLTDCKVPSLKKEKAKVMLTNNTILWVISSRISEISKVTAASTDVLSITLKIEL